MKKLSILFVLFGTLFILSPETANATHMMGSDITWTCIGQDSFMIKVTIYRDCNGVQLGNATVPFKCKSTGSTITSLSISKPAPVDITPTCGSSCTRCQSHSCSFPYGIEQYSFQKMVVLSGAGSCCEIVMSYTMCCRNSAITTGAANKNFYVEAIMNRCQNPCDNSPLFTNPPIAIICIGQDFMFNHGVTDNNISSTGGLLDSLAYEWTYPLQSAGSTISFTGAYDYNKPVFFWGFPNANLPFPRGFHLDPITGDISFRPMKIEQTVMAITVKEYRNGTFIGQVRRDLQVIVINCPNNHAPVLSGPFYKEVCAGSPVTFSIATNDYDPNDTLRVGWNAAIPGAIWTDNNDQVKHPTGSLTWTPSENHASPIPYVFTVTVKDDACPVNGSSTRAYQILVKPLPRANITLTDSGCGDYWFIASPIVGASPSYKWVGNFNPGFTKNGPVAHYKFSGPGKYPYTMTMTAKQCDRTYYDTVDVDTFLMITRINDTDLCYGDTITYGAMYRYNSGDVTFQWNTSPNDTLQYKHIIASKDSLISFTVEDTLGCKASDNIYINMHQHPQLDVGPDLRLCSYGSELVTGTYVLDENGLDSIWWEDKNKSQVSVMDKITISDSGKYVFKVLDSLGCFGNDTLTVVKSPEIIATGTGTTICYGEVANIYAQTTGSGTANVQYKWFNGSTFVQNGQSINVAPTTTTDYKLLITEEIDGVECRDSTTVRVKVNPLPDITISPIPERCVELDNSSILKLNDYVTTNPYGTTKTWTSSTTPDALVPVYPSFDQFHPRLAGAGLHTVTVHVTNPITGCVDSAYSFVKVNALPVVDAGDDDTLCTGDGNYALVGDPLIPAGEWRPLGSHNGVEGSPGNQVFNPTASGISDAGSYYVIYKYTNPVGCINEDTVRLTVYETPNTQAGTYPDMCIYDAPAVLAGTPTGGKWSGNGVSYDIANNQYIFDPATAGLGTSTLTYSVKNGVCKVDNQTNITVYPRPTVMVGTYVGSTTFCSNDGWIALMGNPEGGTWTGQGVQGTNFFTGIVGDVETSYDLEYKYIDQYGCENTKTLTLTVRPEPSIVIDKSQPTLCFPDQFDGMLTYKHADGVEWHILQDSAFGNFTTATDQPNATYVPSYSDLKRLRFHLYANTTHNDNVCAPAYDTIKVLLSAIPSANMAVNPPRGCTPLTVDFVDSSTITEGKITSWDWDFGDGSSSTIQNPTHEYTKSGAYVGKLTAISNAGCRSTKGFTVEAKIVPEAGFIPEPDIVTISASTINFKNMTKYETPGIEYRWYFNDPSVSDGGRAYSRDTSYKYLDTGTYNVVLFAINEWGCKDTFDRDVIVLPDVIAFIPNAFSPDGIGEAANDTFKVYADGFTEFDLKIYSRWGELLYESTDYESHGWTGTYLNSTKPVPVGAYVYILLVKGLDGGDYKYSGTVTLVK